MFFKCFFSNQLLNPPKKSRKQRKKSFSPLRPLLFATDGDSARQTNKLYSLAMIIPQHALTTSQDSNQAHMTRHPVDNNFREKYIKTLHRPHESQFFFLFVRIKIGEKLDQFRFLVNCPPTPPLTQHFALSEKPVLMLT